MRARSHELLNSNATGIPMFYYLKAQFRVTKDLRLDVIGLRSQLGMIGKFRNRAKLMLRLSGISAAREHKRTEICVFEVPIPR